MMSLLVEQYDQIKNFKPTKSGDVPSIKTASATDLHDHKTYTSAGDKDSCSEKHLSSDPGSEANFNGRPENMPLQDGRISKIKRKAHNGVYNIDSKPKDSN
jgi:anti-sigma28 factor (negative regulator of flagellin synthesis)